jgi:hypothetical protein
MNLKAVGIENLPNIYIDNIEVRSMDGGTRVSITVDVLMYEHSPMHSWRNKVDGLKLKCALISNDDRIARLNSGELSLYEISPLRRNVIVDSCDQLSPAGLVRGYKKYKKSFQFNMQRPNNLNVYVATFIDDLNFGISQFDKFYGPMTAERIFVGGQINRESGYFYYPDTNEEYIGPVHQSSDGYMEGSEHTGEAHSDLIYVTEENKKISNVPSISITSRGIILS